MLFDYLYKSESAEDLGNPVSVKGKGEQERC